jgi:hypothetical protein
MQLIVNILLCATMFSSLAVGLPTGTSPTATTSSSTHHHHIGTRTHTGTYSHDETHVHSETAAGHYEHTAATVTNAHNKVAPNVRAADTHPLSSVVPGGVVEAWTRFAESRSAIIYPWHTWPGATFSDATFPPVTQTPSTDPGGYFPATTFAAATIPPVTLSRVIVDKIPAHTYLPTTVVLNWHPGQYRSAYTAEAFTLSDTTVEAKTYPATTIGSQWVTMTVAHGTMTTLPQTELLYT